MNVHFQYWVTRATPKEEEEGNNNNNNNNSIGNSKGRRRKSEKEERRLERRRESQVEEKYGANGVDIGLQVHLIPLRKCIYLIRIHFRKGIYRIGIHFRKGIYLILIHLFVSPTNKNYKLQKNVINSAFNIFNILKVDHCCCERTRAEAKKEVERQKQEVANKPKQKDKRSRRWIHDKQTKT